MTHALRPAFAGRILTVTEEVALEAAALSVPDPRPMADTLIGATAKVAGATLVTRNVGDFGGFRLKIIDPWDLSQAGA